MNLQPLLDSTLDGRLKGFPQDRPPLRLGDAGSQGWSLLQGLPTPVALLKASALEANAAWMGAFLRRSGASLCPHGKTTMAPQLFQRQLADGAWGITLATPQHARIAVDFGVKRVLLANQVTDASALAWIQQAMGADAHLDLTCLVDSPAGVALLAARPWPRPLPVLLEVGIPEGRCGVRDLETALNVARVVKTAPGLCLRGVECFEGIVMSPDAASDRTRIEAWLDLDIAPQRASSRRRKCSSPQEAPPTLTWWRRGSPTWTSGAPLACSSAAAAMPPTMEATTRAS